MFKLAIFAASFVLTVNSTSLYEECKLVTCDVPPCEGVRNPLCIESFCGKCKATCYTRKGNREKPCRFEKGTPNHRIQRRLNAQQRKWKGIQRLQNMMIASAFESYGY